MVIWEYVIMQNNMSILMKSCLRFKQSQSYFTKSAEMRTMSLLQLSNANSPFQCCIIWGIIIIKELVALKEIILTINAISILWLKHHTKTRCRYKRKIRDPKQTNIFSFTVSFRFLVAPCSRFIYINVFLPDTSTVSKESKGISTSL